VVLYPINPHQEPVQRSKVISAWAAVLERQTLRADSYWLIAQPDHAALAGDLAVNFSSPDFPRLDDEVVRAVALHDAGWAEFDGGSECGSGTQVGHRPPPTPMRDGSGRPLSFLQVLPRDFVRAWENSIECASRGSPLGGLLVSGHFCRLAEHRMDSANDTCEDTDLIRSFLKAEKQRQGELMGRQERAQKEINQLIDILQFCDLLSLYLCCRARAEATFPQNIASSPVTVRREGEVCVLDPSPFAKGLSLGVAARRDPTSKTEANAVTLPLLIK